MNAMSEKYGTALQAASYSVHEEITKLRLENGADVNAAGGRYGTALQAASRSDHKEIVRLLLSNRTCNVSAEGGKYGTALRAASYRGHEEMVRILLENGTIADDRTLEDALYSGKRSIEKLIRDTLKSQPSSVRGPTTPFLDEEPSCIPVGMR